MQGRVYDRGRKRNKFAQFIAVCRRSKWSKHVTNSPFFARLAMPGSNAACKISSGIVNLIALISSGGTKGTRGANFGLIMPLGSHRYARDLAPHLDSFLHLSTVFGCGKQMTSWSKVLRDRAIRREEPLGMTR
jgi:hypothetical protein